MARKTTTVVIAAEGRDHGKHFLITEMPAMRAEKWAARALLALGQSGIDIPDDAQKSGIAGMASLGLRAFVGVPWHLAEPLLDEMFRCVAFVPNPARPEVVRDLIEDDIEEVATRVRLREEVLSLHVGFSIAERLSQFRAASATNGPGSDTPTSPASSAP